MGCTELKQLRALPLQVRPAMFAARQATGRAACTSCLLSVTFLRTSSALSQAHLRSFDSKSRWVYCHIAEA